MVLETLNDIKALHPSALRILTELRRKKSATRVNLASSTGLSSQTLTRIGKELLESDLIIEGERKTGGRGQPAIYLSLKQDKLVSIGVVLEHDQITVIADDVCGENIARLRRKGDFQSAEESMKTCTDMLQSIIAEVSPGRIILGIGVSVSGFFSDDAGRICSRNDPEGWSGFIIRDVLEQRFDLPVYVANDGTAAAQGYALQGDGLSFHSFFLILVTKGVGGGFVYDGRLIRGLRGNAGEIAALLTGDVTAVRPTEESLEQFLSEHWQHPKSLWDYEIALKEKDEHLNEWLDTCAASLTGAFNAIHSLFDPEAIVLAGRTPPAIRQALLYRIELKGPTFAGISPPQPKLVVDPTTDTLGRGAVALPIAEFFDRPFVGSR